MQQWLTTLWYGSSGAASALQPLSSLYGAAVSARRRAYRSGLRRSHRVGRPVIVVGNLTVGGTGKTPLVAWLSQQLANLGWRVGIASRGYGRKSRAPRLVDAGTHWQEVGDEPLLLHRRTGCPVMVSADRVAAAEALVRQGVDVVVTDDGLQHLRLARDCEIVVIDGARGFGNRRLLPAGPLREPIDRLREAHIVVTNGPAVHASLDSSCRPSPGNVLEMTLVPGRAMRIDGTGEGCELEAFRGRKVHAVAGIGHPERFFRELRAHGIDASEHAFADHHPLTRSDLAFSDDLPVLMTEKDAVKCRPFADSRLWYVPVTAHFDAVQTRQLLDEVQRRIGG